MSHTCNTFIFLFFLFDHGISCFAQGLPLVCRFIQRMSRNTDMSLESKVKVKYT